MCTVVDTDVVLANLLHYFPEVGAHEMNAFVSKVEGCTNSVYLDVTSEGCVWATNIRPDLFRREGNKIQRVFEWSKEWVDRCFTWRVPKEAREIFDNALIDLAKNSCS